MYICFCFIKQSLFFKLASTFSAFLHPPTRGQPKHFGVIFWEALILTPKVRVWWYELHGKVLYSEQGVSFCLIREEERPEKGKQTREEWNRSPSHDFPPQGPGLEID